MGNLTLQGATSGQITLAPTAVAGTNTVTLPATTGTVVVTSTGTIPSLVSRQYSNLNITASSSSVALTADSVTVSTASGSVIPLTGVSIPTISISTTGANALDTGTLTSNTFYAVYVIYNSNTSTTAALLSTNASTPALPSGYTYYARFGWVYATSASALLPTIQKNTFAEYITPVTAVSAVNVGSSVTALNLQSGSTKYIPTTSSRIIGALTQNTGVVTASIYKNSSTNSLTVNINTGSQQIFPLTSSFEFNLQSNSIYYSGTSVTILIGGWVDNL
jgi:hypothetical protein